MATLTFSRMILLRKIPEGGLTHLKEMALSSFSDMTKAPFLSNGSPSRGLNVILIINNIIYIIYYYINFKEIYNRILGLVLFAVCSFTPQGRFMGVSTLRFDQQFDLIDYGGICRY
jgi:hypothetical protein